MEVHVGFLERKSEFKATELWPRGMHPPGLHTVEEFQAVLFPKSGPIFETRARAPANTPPSLESRAEFCAVTRQTPGTETRPSTRLRGDRHGRRKRAN